MAQPWKAVTAKFREIVRAETGKEFPQDAKEQIRLATEAVFRSWNGKRAVDYRNAAKIAHDLGTAVNVAGMARTMELMQKYGMLKQPIDITSRVLRLP